MQKRMYCAIYIHTYVHASLLHKYPSDKRTNHPATPTKAAPSHTKAFNYCRPLIIY